MSILRKLKNIIEPSYKRFFMFCLHLFRCLPVNKNKIVFIQGCGQGYRCNLKYIAEEIHRQQLPYDMVWLVRSKDIEVPSFVRKVKYNRIRAVYELATCRVMINNTKSRYPVNKKKGQIYIYIPHGQPGCKCAEGDAVLTEKYIEASKEHSSLTDVFVSMGKYHTQVLKDTFWIPANAEIWETGYPRNDQFIIQDRARQSRIRKQLGISDDTHIAFYAPTFRDNGQTNAYDLDLHRVLDTLERKTGDKWIFFITLHNNFAWFAKPVYPIGARVRNMTGYTDIHELLTIADIAISDYSSVALDFANTRRPVFLYASDIDQYTKMRGLKPMYYQMPFPLARNNDEMELNILNYNKEEYLKLFDEWMKDSYGSIDDGHASERLVERLKEII